MAGGLADGARLMRASFELVRREPALLWFPVISTCCLVVSAGFWIFEGAWLYAVNGAWFLYVPLVAIGLYSLFFVGIFFNVALAGAAAQILDGEETTVGDGLDVAWSRLGGIAGWAGYSLFVAFVVSFVKSIRGLRWLGAAAQVAWSFATIFVVPLIAFEGLDSEGARRRSFQLVKENWRTETGGLGALRAAFLVPGLLFYLDAKLLFEGHVHSPGAKALLGFVLLCGFALSAAVSVVRQVFAVELYRVSTG
ncbi:MAG: hypothetical protein E6F94_09850 [Actinobacteria bacterium]|nr:MAG: hypothetical protein E6F94_09850 [Actinomycetota bacterium]